MPRRNKFVSFNGDPGKAGDIAESLQRVNIRYIYYSSDVKRRHLANLDPLVVQRRQGMDVCEQYLLDRSRIIFECGDHELYEIDLNRLDGSRQSQGTIPFSH